MTNLRFHTAVGTRAATLALLVWWIVPGCRPASVPPTPTTQARPAQPPAYRIVQVHRRLEHYNLDVATWDPNVHKTTRNRHKAVYDVQWTSREGWGPFGTFTLDATAGWEARAHATIRASIRAWDAAKADANTLRDHLQESGRQP